MARPKKKQLSFVTSRTNARWTIRCGAHGQYYLECRENGGELLFPTLHGSEYKNKATAIQALREIAAMFEATGNLVQWEEEEK